MTYQQMLTELRSEERQLAIAEEVMVRVGPHPKNPAFQDDYAGALARAIEARQAIAELYTAIAAEEE